MRFSLPHWFELSNMIPRNHQNPEIKNRYTNKQTENIRRIKIVVAGGGSTTFIYYHQISTNITRLHSNLQVATANRGGSVDTYSNT